MARIAAPVTSCIVEAIARARSVVTSWFWIVTPRSHPPNGMTHRMTPSSQLNQRTGIG